jgi:hypothetical protein
MSGENAEKNFFDTYSGNTPPGGKNNLSNRRKRVQKMMGTTSGSNNSGQGPTISPSNAVPNWSGPKNNNNYNKSLLSTGGPNTITPISSNLSTITEGNESNNIMTPKSVKNKSILFDGSEY